MHYYFKACSNTNQTLQHQKNNINTQFKTRLLHIAKNILPFLLQFNLHFPEVEELLNYIKTVHPISAEAALALQDICVEVACKKNTILQPIGHTCKTIYFVVKGALRIYYFKNETDITESFEFENAIVARAESLFSGRPSRKAIQAIEDSSLIAINSPLLFNLYDAHHDLERLFCKIFEEAYVKTVNRLEALQFHTAEERYNNLLHDHPDVLKRVPLKYISSFLGITAVSLSRIRAKR